MSWGAVDGAGTRYPPCTACSARTARMSLRPRAPSQGTGTRCRIRAGALLRAIRASCRRRCSIRRAPPPTGRWRLHRGRRLRLNGRGRRSHHDQRRARRRRRDIDLAEVSRDARETAHHHCRVRLDDVLDVIDGGRKERRARNRHAEVGVVRRVEPGAHLALDHQRGEVVQIRQLLEFDVLPSALGSRLNSSL